VVRCNGWLRTESPHSLDPFAAGENEESGKHTITPLNDKRVPTDRDQVQQFRPRHLNVPDVIQCNLAWCRLEVQRVRLKRQPSTGEKQSAADRLRALLHVCCAFADEFFAVDKA
jgi:hypothetical protein